MHAQKLLIFGVFFAATILHLSQHELRRFPAYCSCIIVYQQGIMYDLTIFDSSFGSLFQGIYTIYCSVHSSAHSACWSLRVLLVLQHVTDLDDFHNSCSDS